MRISIEEIRAMARVQQLTIPEDELDNVATRLSTWLTAMEQIEEEMGSTLDHTDPIPPVFPREEY